MADKPTIDLFLPDERWRTDLKTAVQDPKVLAALLAAGFALAPAVLLFSPIAILSGGALFQYTLVGYVVTLYLKAQRRKKIRAVIAGMPGRFTEQQLEAMAAKSPAELDRLFRLASDDFFREYIREQGDHKKAQKLIVTLQERIGQMRDRICELEKNADKNAAKILQLESDMRIYEDVLSGWKKTAA